jgi:hypothetical protein
VPRSRGRKKAKPKTPRGNGGVVFQRMSFDGIDREKLKQALLESARESLAEFPGHLAELQRIFRELPQKILFYGAQGSISEKGETRSFAKYILQHHIELLQALMLTVPVIADCPDRPTNQTSLSDM